MCDKPRKVKPYLCSDCGTTNIDDFYETSKGKCKTCQYESKKKLKIDKPRKVKPYLCKHCGSTNPDDFEIGLKTTCHHCDLKLRRKTEPRKVKPHLCSGCGTTDINNFNVGSKGKCKSCQSSIKKKNYKPVQNVKRVYNKPHLCKSCGATDPTEFYSKRKNMCKPCDRKANKKTDRILKPSGIIIPDDITDPIQREKYYKQAYHAKWHPENKHRFKTERYKEQKKIYKKKCRIRKYCKKHNLSPDEFLNDFDKYNQFVKNTPNVIKQHECVYCKSIENTHPYNGYGYICDTCVEGKNDIKTITTQVYNFDFIRKAQAVHSDKPYTYENTIYKNNSTKVEVNCQIHGSFYVIPHGFFRTLIPCSGCRKDALPNTNTIIEESKKIYGDDVFDYSKVNYINKEIKLTFICKKHNHEFEQLFKNHKRKKIGCYHCLNYTEERFNIAKLGGTIAGANKKERSVGFIKQKKYTNNHHNEEKINKFIIENTTEVITNIETPIINYKIETSIKKYKDEIRDLIRAAIIKQKPIRKRKTEKILGCSCQEARDYIESKFEPWMNWSNYGKHIKNKYNVSWDIDHIIPLRTSATIGDVETLNHFTNLQPLCSEYNRYVKKDLIL